MGHETENGRLGASPEAGTQRLGREPIGSTYSEPKPRARQRGSTEGGARARVLGWAPSRALALAC